MAAERSGVYVFVCDDVVHIRESLDGYIVEKPDKIRFLRPGEKLLTAAGNEDAMMVVEINSLTESERNSTAKARIDIIGELTWSQWVKVLNSFGVDAGKPSGNNLCYVEGQSVDEIDEFVLALAEYADAFSPEVIWHGNEIGDKTKAGFPRFWDLFSFLLFKEARERVFEPAYQDLMADYARARASQYQTPLARAWIKFCFGFRTALLILESVRVIATASFIGALYTITPTWLKRAFAEWLWSWFRHH